MIVKRFADHCSDNTDHWIEYEDGTRLKATDSEIHYLWQEWICNHKLRYIEGEYLVFEFDMEALKLSARSPRSPGTPSPVRTFSSPSH